MILFIVIYVTVSLVFLLIVGIAMYKYRKRKEKKFQVKYNELLYEIDDGRCGEIIYNFFNQIKEDSNMNAFVYLEIYEKIKKMENGDKYTKKVINGIEELAKIQGWQNLVSSMEKK